VLEKKADLYLKFDRSEKAEELLKALLLLKRTAKPPVHPVEIANILDKLARVAARVGKFEEALKFYDEAIALKAKEYGDNNYHVARSMNGKSQLLFQQKQYNEAKLLAFRVKAILEIERGKENSEVGIALDNLAKIHAALGNRDKAHNLFRYSTLLGPLLLL